VRTKVVPVDCVNSTEPELHQAALAYSSVGEGGVNIVHDVVNLRSFSRRERATPLTGSPQTADTLERDRDSLRTEEDDRCGRSRETSARSRALRGFQPRATVQRDGSRLACRDKRLSQLASNRD
jgi:hypothetical protein